jgi:hypothetical protein
MSVYMYLGIFLFISEIFIFERGPPAPPDIVVQARLSEFKIDKAWCWHVFHTLAFMVVVGHAQPKSACQAEGRVLCSFQNASQH